MDSSHWAVLLLLLPLLHSSYAQRVKVRDEVTGFVGQDVTLPCTFSPDDPNLKITQVTWTKEAGGKKTSVGVYNPNLGTSLPFNRISFLKASLQEPTLIIRSLMMGDEGTYTCEFATYPNGNEEGVTKLVLLAEPSNYAEAIQVVAGNGEATVANCTSANGKPRSEITWQSSLPGNISTMVTNNTDGTYTVNSQYKIFPTSEADGKTVTCVITYKTASVPQRIPLTLSIKYPPEVSIQGYDDNWYINRPQAELKCAANSNPPVTKYQWKLANGQPLPNNVEVIGNLLVVKTVDNLLNTTLTCEATNSLGTGSQTFAILVRERALPQQAEENIGVIVGAVLGTLLLIALVAVLVFFILRRRKTKEKSSYTTKKRIFGNGATSQPVNYHENSELGKPLQGTPRQIELPHTHADEDDDEKQHSELLEEDEERFNEVGPMLQLRSHNHHDSYHDDDMESQKDGSMISKTAVYV